MRNYKETVAWIAEGIFGRYMSGCMNEYAGVDFQFVAFVYDKTPTEVENDIEGAVAVIKDRFYANLREKNIV